MIPMRSSNPTTYLPKFSPLWAPDKALKPITSAFNFHFASFTSIQCAVMPRNPVFVISADHPSAVTDTFPGAAYVSSKLPSIFERRWLAYWYRVLQLPDMLHEFVMKLEFHIVRTRKVAWGWFWSHGDKGIAKGGIIGKCEGLQVRGQLLFWQWSALKLYLVVCSDQLSYGLESTCPREFAGTRHRCKVQQLLCFLLRRLASLRLLLLFLHGLPNGPWNRPMSHRYVCIFAFFLVDLVVLTNMKMTGRIPSFVECLALPVHFCELLIISATQ